MSDKSDNPNIDNSSNIRMQPRAQAEEGGGAQQAEYVEGTLPVYLVKSYPGAGYEAPPEGTDMSGLPPVPPPPSDTASMDDPVSGGNPPAGAAPPVNVDVPYVSQNEDLLTCTMGNWTGEPTGYDYVWKLDGATVGSNSADYTIAVDDIGKTATCTVTASNAAGATAAPPSSGVIVADPTGP